MRSLGLGSVLGVLLAVAGAGVPAEAAAPAGGGRTISTREIRVEGPGTVRVELGAGEIALLGDAGGVDVVTPGGERFGAERILARDEAPCRDVEIVALERVADGYQVRLRVPADAGRHAALDFELDRATLAAGCRLEASAHGRKWRPLAEGDLFRLGDPSPLARTRLEYPPTDLRELRLDWPSAAGYPRIRGARVCAPVAAGPPLRLAVEARRLEAPGDRTRFVLAVPSRAVRLSGLVLSLPAAPARPSAWRLELPRDGRPRELDHGLWPASSPRHRIDLGDVAFDAPVLLLEIFGPPVDALEAEWELSPQIVRFEAASAGSYRLELPAPARRTRAVRGEAAPAEPAPPVTTEARWPAPAPGAELAETELAGAWSVSTDGIPAGAPAEVALTGDVLAVSRPDRSDLRLASGGRQVPSRLETAALPAVVRIVGDLDPSPAGNGRSAVELDLAGVAEDSGGLRLVLGAGAAVRPFRRSVNLIAWTRRPGTDRERRLGGGTWSCESETPLPCELPLELGAQPVDRVRIEIFDGDSAPLSGLTVEVLEPRQRLVFLAPAGALELVAESPGASRPHYDLTALDAALGLASPARAEIGVAIPGRVAKPSSAAHGLLIAAVVLVALALLALLRRLLPVKPPTG